VLIALQYESEHEQCASPSVPQLFAATPEATYFLFYVEGNCQSADLQPKSFVPIVFERYSLFCCRKLNGEADDRKADDATRCDDHFVDDALKAM
jgi:hypothetical protein